MKADLHGGDLALGTNSKVPRAHIDWLHKLFKFAATTKLHQKRADLIPGLTFIMMDGPATDAMNGDIYRYSEPIIRAIGLHLDDANHR